MTAFEKIVRPVMGEAIEIKSDNTLMVPDQPIIPFIQGDGIGEDITPAMQTVVNAAVEKAYGSERKIQWMEVYAGDKATQIYGDNQYLPQETMAALSQYNVSIKGPLMTPVGGGMRSLNVALRQNLDLYVCQRPVRYYSGTPSPVKHPEQVDMVIFRENSEDIYAGIEWQAGSRDVEKVIQFLQQEMGVNKIRFPASSGIGIKPVSREGTERLVRKAMQYAIDNDRDSLTIVHKGNIMKFTEGGFKQWAYDLIADEFNGQLIDNGPWQTVVNPNTGKVITIKDCIADAFLQEIVLHPQDHDVVATLNLNGDYISDALAAQVGGIGIAPGANLSDSVAIFEATHGTAPDLAGKNKANPSSLILSAEMLLRHIHWNEAAQHIVSGVSGAIQARKVTVDLADSIGVDALSCSDYAAAIIEQM